MKSIILFIIIAVVSLSIKCIQSKVQTIHESEVRSLDWLIKQYRLDWTISQDNQTQWLLTSSLETAYINTNTTDNRVTKIFIVRNKQSIEINSGRIEDRLETLYFPSLRVLELSDIPNDGSYNAYEMFNHSTSLYNIAITNHYISHYPDQLGYSHSLITFASRASTNRLPLPRDMNIYKYPKLELSTFYDPLDAAPDGFLEGMTATSILFYLGTEPLEPNRFPESMCSGSPVYGNSLPDLLENMAPCIKCSADHYTRLQPIHSYCDTRIIGMKYDGQTVTIYGNDFGRGQGNNITTTIIGNNMIMYDRPHLSLVEERIDIGKPRYIDVSYTSINFESVSFKQVPFGIRVSFNVNYNQFISHTFSVDGVPCKRDTIKYYEPINLTTCFILSSPSSSRVLSSSISNIKQSELRFNYYLKKYPIIKNISRIDDMIQIDGYYGDSDIQFIDIKFDGTINCDLINITSNNTSNSSTINCLLHNNNNNNNNNIHQLTSSYYQWNTSFYLNINGHSYESLISIIIPGRGGDSSSSSSKDGDSSSSSKESDHSSSSSIKYYIIGSVSLAVLLSVLLFFAIQRTRRHNKSLPVIIRLKRKLSDSFSF